MATAPRPILHGCNLGDAERWPAFAAHVEPLPSPRRDARIVAGDPPERAPRGGAGA
jgi:hypothetical protein